MNYRIMAPFLRRTKSKDPVIGKALRDIEAGEVICTIHYPGGLIESDCIEIDKEFQQAISNMEGGSMGYGLNEVTETRECIVCGEIVPRDIRHVRLPNGKCLHLGCARTVSKEFEKSEKERTGKKK